MQVNSDTNIKELQSHVESQFSKTQAQSEENSNFIQKALEEKVDSLRKEYEKGIQILSTGKISKLERKLTIHDEQMKASDSITKDMNSKLSQRMEEISEYSL